MKHIKRTISALLVLVMVLGMLPMSVFASEETVPETAPVETAAVTEAAAEETTAPAEAEAEETVPAETLTVEVSHEQEAMDVSRYLPGLAFYSSPVMTQASLITEFGADPNGENVFYFGFNRYGGVEEPTWMEPIDGTFVLNNPDMATVEKVSSQVYKITLNEAANDAIAGKGEGETWDFVVWHSAICHWFKGDVATGEWVEEETTGAAHLILYNAYPEKSYDTLAGAYLTCGWLKNDGNGWYEDASVGNEQNFGLMPGQEQYLIFYLNVYTSGIGSQMNRIPVHVQLSQPGSVDFQQLSSSEIRSGETNGKYFYRVTTDTWDQHLGIMDVDNGIGGVEVHTNRYEMCAYTSPNMSNSTCVPACYVADVSEGAKNELYVGLDSDWNAQSMTVDFGADLITLEATGNQNVRRVVITDQGMENLRKGWDVYVAVKAQNGNREAYANFRISPNPATIPEGEKHEPYLTYYGIDSVGEEWFIDSNKQPLVAYGMTSLSTWHVLYMLNLWNAQLGQYEAFPVIPESNSHFTFTPMKDEPETYLILDSEPYGDYFVRAESGGDLYHHDYSIIVHHDGETYELPYAEHRKDIAFYSASYATVSTMLPNNVSLVSGKENCYYLVQLTHEDCSIRNLTWRYDDWGNNLNGIVSDGQLIDFEDLGNGVWKFTIDPEYVELTKQPGGVWQNFFLYFECDVDYYLDGVYDSTIHWGNYLAVNPAGTDPCDPPPVVNPEPEDPPTLGMTQEELEAAMAAAEGSYLLTQSVTLTRDMETVGCNLVIENGAVLTVPQGVTLTVNNPGLYIQPGGKLIVDGKLVQQGIISNKFGLLQVNGTFVKGDENGAVGVHADADTISEVVGIDKKDQFVTVYASGLEDIRIAAGYTEYQYVEVGMPTLELNEELTIPEHMVLIFIGGDGHGAKTHNQTTFGQNAEVNVNGKLIINSFNAEMSQTLVNNGTINVHGGGELMINSFPSDDYNKEHTQAIVNNGNINVWGQLIHNNGSITNNGELTVHTGSHTFVSETARVRNNGQCNQGFEASTDIRGVWEGNPINVDDGTATDPYLTWYWLDNWGEGWFINPENGGPHPANGLRSCAVGHAVYFLNLWNEEKNAFEAFPVIPESNEHFSFHSMKDDPENNPIKAGEEYADYYCWVQAGGDLHHHDYTIDVKYGGETYTLPFSSYRIDIAFYSEPKATTDTLMEVDTQLVSGEENSYYVIHLEPEDSRIENFTWYVDSWGEDYNALVSDGQLIDCVDLGNGIWKFTVDPEYVELTKQPGGIWKNFCLRFECEVVYSEDDVSHWGGDQWIHPAETTDPYLSIVWLDNEENGWFWNTERQPEKLFGMGGATHCYNLYFLNVWNAAKGEYEAKPIIPQGNGEDVFITPLSEMEGEIVLEGEEYGDYFVQTRVGGNLYYDLSKISVNYNGKTLTFPFEVYSREVAFFSRPEAKAEYLLEGHQDLKYGEENVYYVALLQPDHHIAENFKWYVHTWDEDYNQFVSDGQFIDFEQVNKGLWKFTIDPEYVEYTKQPNPNWIWKNFDLVFECDLRDAEGNDYGHWAQDIWINPADASIKDEASLRKQAVEGAEIIAITGDIVLTSDLAIPELFVEIDGGSITVPAGKTLTIGEYGKYGTQTQTNYTLSLYNGGSIVVESGATLIIQEFTYVSGGGSILVKEGGKVIFKDNCTCELDGSVQVLGTAEFGKHPADPERITAVAQVYNSGALDATVKGIPDENLFLLYNIYSDADMENAVKLHKEKSFARFAFEVYEDVTLKQDLTIGESDFLEAFRGSLTIAEGCKIINNGYIQSYNIEGDVETVTNRGTIENNGEIFLDGGNFRNDGVIDQKEGGSIYIIRDGIFYNNGTVNAYEGSSVTIEAGKWEGNEPVDVAPTSGICGGTLTWEFDPETGTLTIKGLGEMFDFILNALMRSPDPVVPWAAYQSQIKQVILPEGLTNIGNNAFAGCENLTEITIPKTVTAVGSGAFVNCSGLKEVSFQGNAPEVAENAFENVEATITYPRDNATWTEDKMQDFGGALTWEPETGHEYKLGDVNHDGKINAKDATLILQKSVGVLKPTAKFCEECAEVSGDGKLNAKDSTLILQFSVGLREIFPAQEK